MHTAFNNIISKYRKLSFSERDKGARFERLMRAYLQTDPKYAAPFKKVWLRNEFFAKNDWAREQGTPRYILDLLLSAINVSVQTVVIVKNLPEMEFDSLKKEEYQDEKI